MSNTRVRTAAFTGKEIGIVVGSIVGYIILAIVAVRLGLIGLMILGPILILALVIGSVALAIWLLMKFGTIMVRNGVIAAHNELERRGVIPPVAEP